MAKLERTRKIHEPVLPSSEEIAQVEDQSQEPSDESAIEESIVDAPEPDTGETLLDEAVVENPTPHEQEVKSSDSTFSAPSNATSTDTIPNGWHSINDGLNIHALPRNGMPVKLSEEPEGEGVLSFWKRTRAFHAKRWQETGKWCDFMTGADISFVPLFWKERYES